MAANSGNAYIDCVATNETPLLPLILNGSTLTITPPTTFNSSLTCAGDISSGSSSYICAGGLRIGGWDGNTLYNDTRAFGITKLNNIYFSTGTSLANYRNRLVIDTVGNVGINNTSPWVDFFLKFGRCKCKWF